MEHNHIINTVNLIFRSLFSLPGHWWILFFALNGLESEWERKQDTKTVPCNQELCHPFHVVALKELFWCLLKLPFPPFPFDIWHHQEKDRKLSLIDAETIGRNLINEKQLGISIVRALPQIQTSTEEITVVSPGLSLAVRCLSTLLVCLVSTPTDENNHILSRRFCSISPFNRTTRKNRFHCLLVSFHPSCCFFCFKGIIGRYEALRQALIELIN